MKKHIRRAALLAAAAMALSSNGVLLNALRLKKYEPRNI